MAHLHQTRKKSSSRFTWILWHEPVRWRSRRSHWGRCRHCLTSPYRCRRCDDSRRAAAAATAPPRWPAGRGPSPRLFVSAAAWDRAVWRAALGSWDPGGRWVGWGSGLAVTRRRGWTGLPDSWRLPDERLWRCQGCQPDRKFKDLLMHAIGVFKQLQPLSRRFTQL